MVVLCDCGMAASGGVRSCCLVLSCLVLSLSSVVSVFGVVRAQLCEHAVIPEHHCVFSLLIVCFAFFLFSSAPRFFFFLCSPPFCVWNGGVCVYHVSVCSVGMTAMGSLSRPPSFFW